MDWEEAGKLIEKYNVKLQPCLALKNEGEKDYWSAGIVELTSGGTQNFVSHKLQAYYSTPIGAVRKAIAIYKKTLKNKER